MEKRMISEAHCRQIVRNFLEVIGENPEREGLRDTPERVRKSWDELFAGYSMEPREILSRVFEEGSCDEMVIVKNIEFHSFCEHHLLPFSGVAHIAYLPNKKVVGVSKLARLVECFSKRLQIQENMTKQITIDFAALARRYDPQTSKDAANSVDVERLQGLVLDMLRDCPSTTQELADFCKMPRDSISPRIRPLVDKGLVMDSGLRRAGPSGRKAIVWRLC